MKKWKVKLPGGLAFEMDSDDPGRELMNRGHTAFALEEITPPPVLPVSTSFKPGKLLLTVREAAEELGVCGKVVYDLTHRADFPTVKIGRRTLISREGLAEWVRNQEQNRGA